MPTEQSYIGSALVPPATPTGDDIAYRDPLLVGLLAFFAFVIKEALDPVVTTQGGPTTSAPVADACPYTFPWNHRNTFMRLHNVGDGTPVVPLPGLWAWSSGEVYSPEQSTLVYDSIERTIVLNYIFPELRLPDGYNARSGLMDLVGKAIQRGVSRGYHPDYDSGTHLTQSLSLLGMVFEKGEVGAFESLPGESRAGGGGRSASSGFVQRFFPAYSATLKVVERIQQPVAEYPSDAMQDSTIAIYAGDDVGDTVETMNRVLVDPTDAADEDP